MPTVEVQVGRAFAAGADTLWQAFTDPAVAASLDERVELVGAEGTPGEVGSHYELAVAYGPVTLRQRVEVTAAQRPRLLETVTTTEGRVHATQTARFEPTADGCRVTWTAVVQPSRLVARRAQRRTEEELHRWLAAAELALDRLPPADG